MAVCGEAMRCGHRRLLRGGWRLSIACHRLSDHCHRLPKPAMTCHGVSDFLRRGGWLAFRPNGDLGNRDVSKLWVDSMFGQVDILKPRFVASDLLMENEGQGICGPVTDCHIDFAGFRRAILARPFRALWFVWRPVPKALPWAAMGRTFGAPEGVVDENAHGAVDGGRA